MNEKILVPGAFIKLLKRKTFFLTPLRSECLYAGNMFFVVSHDTNNGKIMCLSTHGYGHIWTNMSFEVFEKIT